MRNLKKVIALVAVFAMMVTSVAFAQSYSDVKEDDNYYEAIEMLSKLNILTGDDKDGDGVMDFRPNDTITRAEVAAVICRVQDLNNLSQTTTPFTDVPSSHWASGYVAQAAGQGIINGYGDGNFGPEDDVTYEQAVKMFVETLGYTPFVNANGGYPTGHLTAAQRYGVVDGVVGASVGAKATRGQIAQIAFNAIDTPIMDRSSYGKDEEFTIFDGTNNKTFETLLTRDLKAKKFAGVISKNQVASLTGPVDIDTDKKAEIKVDWDGSYKDNKLVSLSKDNANYNVDDMTTVYEADSNAGQYLGYFVEGYARETDRSGEYDIIAITPSNKNKTATIALDQYSSAKGDKIEYYKNDNDNKTTSLTIEEKASVLYNGAYNNKVVTIGTSANIETILNGLGVNKDCKYSGQITLIDNNSTNGYDVIKVDVATPGVVKEAKASGKVVLKEGVKNSKGDKIDLNFDEDAKDTIINLTKDGKKVEYTDLKEWDVLSILYSGEKEYYDVKVLGANKIDGSIASKATSKTSGDGYEYTIDGKTYDVAANCYGAKTETNSKGWSVGTAGVFYIDDYGKIVAYDKNGSTTSSTTNGNYAYIINSSVSSDGFNKVVSLQLLDKSGKVFTDDLADRVKFENGKEVVGTTDLYGTSFDDTQTYKVEGKETALAAALKNRFVTYETNSSNEVKTLTFWNGATEDDNTLYLENSALSYKYDADNKELTVGKKYDVDENTVVFFIKADNADFYSTDSTKPVAFDTKTLKSAKDVTASKTLSKVGTISDIGDESVSSPAAVFDVESGVAGAVVLWDATSGISSSTGIAVIDSIGDTTYNDDNTKLVKFFKDGNKMEAAINPDIINETEGLDSAKKGDLYRVALNADGTLITAARKYASATRYGETIGKIEDVADSYAGDTGLLSLTGIPNITVNGTSQKAVVYGPVYDYSSSSNRIRIATEKAGKYDFNDTDSIKASNANVYVVDPNKKSNKIYVGDASDVNYDNDLIEKDNGYYTNATDKKDYCKYGVVKKNKNDTTNLVGQKVQALGMMDFAAAVYNTDGDVVDVVIYKAYDFNNGKYTIDYVNSTDLYTK